MEIVDAFVVLIAWLLTGGAVLYGCVRIAPGKLGRWAVYGAGAVILVEFGLWPLLPGFGMHLGTADQYVAVALATVGLKMVLEWFVPTLLEV